jgi:hypothetical protein
MAPSARQRASFEKNRGSDSGAVVQRVFLDFKNSALSHPVALIFRDRRIPITIYMLPIQQERPEGNRNSGLQTT